MSVETGENKNIIEYLNENEIAWMPINLEVTKLKILSENFASISWNS